MYTYPTNLTDNQWSKIVNFFAARKRKHPLRSIVNALLYLTKTGVQWRMLPSDFPKWQLVYYYFRKWTSESLIEEIHKYLVGYGRKRKKKHENPNLGLIDSQNVKPNSMTTDKGYDGGKKIQGRKRHIII